MSRLHLPDNIKVHFASMESMNHVRIIGEMGVQYALYSSFPYVFHLCDGVKGLDRLIEFSDYIGIGSGTPQNSGQTMYEVSSYIKEKKPEMDIHLLGCTIPKMIKKCNFCTSCDSVSWVSPLRFGWIGDYHIADLDEKKIINIVGEEVYGNIKKLVIDRNAPAYCASIEINKRIYEKYCGNQDYTRRFV